MVRQKTFQAFSYCGRDNHDRNFEDKQKYGLSVVVSLDLLNDRSLVGMKISISCFFLFETGPEGKFNIGKYVSVIFLWTHVWLLLSWHQQLHLSDIFNFAFVFSFLRNFAKNSQNKRLSYFNCSNCRYNWHNYKHQLWNGNRQEHCWKSRMRFQVTN